MGLYKTECIKIDGPFRTADELELATLSWVHWFNENRLHSSIGYLTPIEKENEYYREINPQSQPALGELALHETRGDSKRDLAQHPPINTARIDVSRGEKSMRAEQSNVLVRQDAFVHTGSNSRLCMSTHVEPVRTPLGG